MSIRQTWPGEAKQAIPIVFGVDHQIECVIVVDDDIDVRNEAEVLWAVATRCQASRNLVVLRGRRRLRTVSRGEWAHRELGIDATCPFGEPSREIAHGPVSE